MRATVVDMKTIEYFYAAHSAFAYIGSARLMEIARAHRRFIVHRPMDLNEAMQAAGSSAFRDRNAAHRRYYFRREIERWAEFRGVRMLGRRPTWHDRPYETANLVLVAAAADGGDADALAHRFLEAHWADDADLSDRATLAALARSQGFDAAALLAAAESAAVRERYAANTQEAIERSVFGSPTYFVDGDMFYGQDHLEQVERALARPFADAWEAR
jgi:2-hydroxychromene-2-carboxylate isomerase